MTREPEYTNPVSFTLTVEQSATLRAYVEVNKISLADVVRECLERGLGIPDPAGRLQGHCTAVSEAGPISVVPRPGRVRSGITAEREAAVEPLRRKRARDEERQRALADVRARQMAGSSAE